MESQYNLASEETETGARPAAAAKFLLYDDPEVLKNGRRPRRCWGASVQLGDTSEIIYTDREIMKKTSMRGEAAVYCSDAWRFTKQAKDWPFALEGGHGGRFLAVPRRRTKTAPTLKRARVHSSLPSTDSEELQVAFYNQLMLLCQVSLQSFSEAMKNKTAKKRKVESVGLVPPRQADAELSAATPPAHLKARQGGAEVGTQALEYAPASAAQPHRARREPLRFQALPVSRDDAQHRSLVGEPAASRDAPHTRPLRE